MPKKLYILFLVLINYVAFAGDSLKTYPKIILGASYSNNYTMIEDNYYDDDFEYWNKKNCEFKTGICVNGDFLINRKSKTANLFYVGLSLNYSQYKLEHQIEDYGYSSHTSYSKSTFSQHDFLHKVNSIGIEPNLSYYVVFKHLVIINKLGLNYNKISSKKTYSYSQESFNQGLEQTPNGYTRYEYTTITNYVDKVNETSFSLSYTFGVGFRIKKLMPSISLRVSHLSDDFNHPYKMFQIGCSYLF